MFRGKPRKVMTLDELPTWSVAGPDSLADHPIPAGTKPKFEPNAIINSKVSFWMRGDSSSLAADAIVNAANSGLHPGGGICGVIHSAAGPELATACEKVSPCPTGGAALTPGFKLPAKYVIHAVGPIGEKPDKLESAYKSTLNYIDGEKIRSVGLCCISTGIYGYPITPATHVALNTVRQWLEDKTNQEHTDRVIFVVFEPRDVNVYYNLVHTYFPLSKEELEKSSAEPEEEGEPKKEEKPKKETPKEEESKDETKE
ncbi:O-acetyl-ADP-ribose deacetylase MACROD1 [Tritrichomonas foetus]|uniref:O-acetyl-ADP-ribose deacetylase MACROD1 n=1 Tax=Tritrichomonas foetus TaxID=1144522 RepID=A0A1J4JAI2_9EUKA|nr:O-acetyl-ADP-ribose deacetylase MACROD1 [Tritrichomonas foetus]|eukprot:OHS94453.1 O-acetyl-ADP-ribose deacetylase MACROD1 [Tritrichomonas foetus]